MLNIWGNQNVVFYRNVDWLVKVVNRVIWVVVLKCRWAASLKMQDGDAECGDRLSVKMGRLWRNLEGGIWRWLDRWQRPDTWKNAERWMWLLGWNRRKVFWVLKIGRGGGFSMQHYYFGPQLWPSHSPWLQPAWVWATGWTARLAGPSGAWKYPELCEDGWRRWLTTDGMAIVLSSSEQLSYICFWGWYFQRHFKRIGPLGRFFL